MTKLPKKIKIGNKIFTVTRPVMNMNMYGETIGHEWQIKVAKRLKGEIANSTLFHEILHAILHTSGLTYVLKGLENNDDSDHDLEEAIVVCLESALFEHVDMDSFTVEE